MGVRRLEGGDINGQRAGEYEGKPTPLGDLAGTRVLVIEGGDEEDRIAAGVDLVMDRALREKGALTLCQEIFDKTSAVLFDEADFYLSAHEVEELGRSWVSVRGVHAAWPDSHELVSRILWDVRGLTPFDRWSWLSRWRTGQGNWQHWQR